jgi:hypothetical protein
MLQARQSITEMVDVSGIRILPSTWTANQFTGWPWPIRGAGQAIT